ncbi:hypothetical protein D3C71_1746740 [compost metagenome]
MASMISVIDSTLTVSAMVLLLAFAVSRRMRTCHWLPAGRSMRRLRSYWLVVLPLKASFSTVLNGPPSVDRSTAYMMR